VGADGAGAGGRGLAWDADVLARNLSSTWVTAWWTKSKSSLHASLSQSAPLLMQYSAQCLIIRAVLSWSLVDPAISWRTVCKADDTVSFSCRAYNTQQNTRPYKWSTFAVRTNIGRIETFVNTGRDRNEQSESQNTSSMDTQQLSIQE